MLSFNQKPSAQQGPSPAQRAEPPANVVASIAAMAKLRFAARELSLFPQHAVKSALNGTRSSRFRGRGMDFDEVRPYQPGDDIRSIDWRVTARTTSPHTKVFREERERPLMVICDLRQNMFFGARRLKSVCACEIASLLAWAGLNAGERIGALVFGPDKQRDIRARRSQHSVLQLIQALHETSLELLPQARPQAEPAASRPAKNKRYSLSEILEDTRRVARPGSNLIIISDFHDLDENGERHLFELARHCDLTLCHIHDSLESQLPPPGQYPVYKGAQRFLLNSAKASLRQRFEQHYRDQEQHLQQTALRLKLPLLSFSTDAPVLDTLRLAFAKRGRRKRS
ncbi:MAG: DUF58 domain-containing protein [Gammaproteobacteria bacterium]|nr:DUF58 domain-containing protein [Gammaproteobacteria bacterium]MBQ0840400.1 DUF58 domain-containing protein [Gammaproteobacteria bacterium]